MANKTIQKLQDKAQQLYDLRQAIASKEEECKNQLEVLKLERDAIQDALLADMNKNGLVSLKVKNGDSFYKGVRKGVEVTNEAHAFKWAIDNRAVSIDKKLVAQKLKDLPEMPSCFTYVQTEFISVRKAKETPEV